MEDASHSIFIPRHGFEDNHVYRSLLDTRLRASTLRRVWMVDYEGFARDWRVIKVKDRDGEPWTSTRPLVEEMFDVNLLLTHEDRVARLLGLELSKFK